MSESERVRQAEMRAARIRWQGRSRLMGQASRHQDERMRRMNERASELDARLRRHGEDNTSWHRKWDDLPRWG